MSGRPPAALLVALLALLVASGPVAAVAGGAAGGTAASAAPADHGDRAATLDRQTERTLTVELIGRTVPDAGIGADARSTVATELGLDTDRVRQRNGTVEMLANRSATEVAAAIRAAGGTAGTVRDGVTNRTRDRAVAVLRERIDVAGLAGNTSVRAAGRSRLVVRTAAPPARVRPLLTGGRVDLVARVPAGEGSRNVTVVEESGFASIGAPTVQASTGTPYVPVTMTGTAAGNFSDAMKRLGFTSDEGVGSCRYRRSPDNPGYCIQTYVDGELVYSASLSAGLADQLRTGEFRTDPRLVLQVRNMTTARGLATALRAGALPAPVEVVETNRTAAADSEPTGDGSDVTASATATPTGDTSTGAGPGPGPLHSAGAIVVAVVALARWRSAS